MMLKRNGLNMTPFMPATWRGSRTKSLDLHVLDMEALEPITSLDEVPHMGNSSCTLESPLRFWSQISLVMSMEVLSGFSKRRSFALTSCTDLILPPFWAQVRGVSPESAFLMNHACKPTCSQEITVNFAILSTTNYPNWSNQTKIPQVTASCSILSSYTSGENTETTSHVQTSV